MIYIYKGLILAPNDIYIYKREKSEETGWGAGTKQEEVVVILRKALTLWLSPPYATVNAR